MKTYPQLVPDETSSCYPRAYGLFSYRLRVFLRTLHHLVVPLLRYWTPLLLCRSCCTALGLSQQILSCFHAMQWQKVHHLELHASVFVRWPSGFGPNNKSATVKKQKEHNLNRQNWHQKCRLIFSQFLDQILQDINRDRLDRITLYPSTLPLETVTSCHDNSTVRAVTVPTVTPWGFPAGGSCPE